MLVNETNQKYGVFKNFDVSMVRLDDAAKVLEEKIEIAHLLKTDLESLEEWQHTDDSYIQKVGDMYVETSKDVSQVLYEEDEGYTEEPADLGFVLDKLQKESFTTEFKCVSDVQDAYVGDEKMESTWEVEVTFGGADVYVIEFTLHAHFSMNENVIG